MTKITIEKTLLGLTVALGFPLGGAVWADEGADQAAGYTALMQTYLEPSADWVQMNEGYTPGGDQPKYWLTSFSRGPANSVLADVNMVSGDDACTMLVHFIYFFDMKTDEIRRAAMVGNGMFNIGSIKYGAEGDYVSIIDLETPDGKITMKDTETLPDNDTRAASAHFLNAETGDWDYRDTQSWHRAPADFKHPC